MPLTQLLFDPVTHEIFTQNLREAVDVVVASVERCRTIDAVKAEVVTAGQRRIFDPLYDKAGNYGFLGNYTPTGVRHMRALYGQPIPPAVLFDKLKEVIEKGLARSGSHRVEEVKTLYEQLDRLFKMVVGKIEEIEALGPKKEDNQVS